MNFLRSPLQSSFDFATRGLDAPFAAVDLDAFDDNATALLRRAGGVPLRLAPKSLRARAPRSPRGGRRARAREGLHRRRRGLARRSYDDRRQALAAARPRACDGSCKGDRRPAGSRARRADGLRGQIAGVGDRPPGRPLLRLALPVVQALSARELARRRAEIVAAVQEIAPLRFVNGGGTGSIERTAAEPAVTEVAAGSGLFGPTLFDTYRAFRPVPAASFALPVVRRPSARVATVLGGGYPASGPAGRDRPPRPVLPPGLRLDAREGAGEVQTPLVGRAAAGLRIGTRVWFRHDKAGELCERFDVVHLISRGELVATVPTYRGEGKTFL